MWDLQNCSGCDACVNACAERTHDGITRSSDGLPLDRYLVATSAASAAIRSAWSAARDGIDRRRNSLSHHRGLGTAAALCAQNCP